MNYSCEEIRSLVSRFSLVQECDAVKNGMLRIATPFQYANGSQIDLFLGEDKTMFEGWMLTDLGQTTAYLLDLHVKSWTTKKRKQWTSDICESLDIRQNAGALFVYIKEQDIDHLPSSIVRLAQACIRVSDLAMTQQFRSVHPFREDLEEFIANLDVPYETSKVFQGKYDNQVEVDFHVMGRKTSSLILTLSTANAVAAHGLCNEVFRRWYDLSTLREKHIFITAYDTDNNVFREEDISRVGELSSVLGFPAEYQQLEDILAA
ncbi:MAG: DUF1828 domain-containing protein [Candidatus Omnitrophota bacterium]